MNRRQRFAPLLAALTIGCGLPPLWAVAQEPAPRREPTVEVQPLRFTRVHVPRGGLSNVPLGDDRYVPMSAREFEQAVARLSNGGDTGFGDPLFPVGRLADEARYEAVVSDDGVLSGTMSFDLGGEAAVTPAAALPRAMPLGRLAVGRGTSRTASGAGEAVVFGRRDGSVAIATPGPGTYACEWKAPAGLKTVDGTAFTLPLVPAVRSVVRLVLPEGFRPVVAGLETPPEPSARADRNEWRIDTGPAPAISFVVVRDSAEPARLSIWSDLVIRGREVALAVAVQPTAAWDAGILVVEKDPTIDVMRVVMPAAGGPGEGRELVWSASEDRRSLMIILPVMASGTRMPVVVEAVAPFAAGERQALPLIGVGPRRWAGGGIVARVDPSLSLAEIELDQAMAVTPEVASRWPLPAVASQEGDAAGRISEARAAAVGVRGPRAHVEQQGPSARVRVLVVPRDAELDVARVTTVDIAPTVVLGRAACDVRVIRGEAFSLAGRVAPGWFIDSVEAVDWPPSGEAIDEPRRREPQVSGELLEWKVVANPEEGGQGSILRIGLVAAATPARSLGLRITGHRAGGAAGAAFSSAELDMVRLEGEADGLAAIGFKTNPETTIEIDGVAADAGLVNPRLAALVEETGVRTWAPAGSVATAWEARLIRRRPPLDVLAQIRLTARDDRLTESFTFECRPDTSDLDAVVVRFSEPMDDLLEWSLLPPAKGTLAARRLESASADRGPAGRGDAAAEAWMIEITPPVREPVTIRAVRAIPFTAPVPVPLAWVEGAARQVGEVLVRDAGRTRPQLVNRRLAELPPRARDVEQSTAAIGDFSFAAETAAATDQTAPAELLPGGQAAAEDARAWAWRESTSCWCHSSGWTEYETLFEIENHGRSSIALGLPPGRLLQGILLDGVRLSSNGEVEAATLSVELPVGRRFVQLLVRTLGQADPGAGFWRVDLDGGTVDLPVLDRRCRVLLPPELEIAMNASGYRPAGFAAAGWTPRLLGARFRQSLALQGGAADTTIDMRPTAAGSIVEGFRERSFVPAPGAATGGLVVVRRRLVVGAAILAGLSGLAFTLVAWRGRPWLAIACCVVAAVAALWASPPFDIVMRSVWWGTLLAALLRRRLDRLAPTAAAAIVAVGIVLAPRPAHGQAEDRQTAPPPAAAAGAMLRVFMIPGDGGGTALVPERLFRVLSRTGVETGGTVRVVSCTVVADVSSGAESAAGPWSIAIDIDNDAGGLLLLDQTASGGRWLPASARLDGRSVAAAAEPGDRLVRLVVPQAGRHRIEIDMEPRVTRAGGVEMATAGIAVAPTATLEFRGADEAAASVAADTVQQCECDRGDGSFQAARRLRSAGDQRIRFDVSRAGLVRIVRPIDPRTRLATFVRLADSRNDVFWNLDACRLHAVYAIDAGDEIVRSIVVAADPALEPVDPADPSVVIRRLEGGRLLLERVRPEPGPVRIELSLRMPLADPVGVFPVPEAWLEAAAVERRTTRLTPSPDLAVQVALPDGMTPAQPRDADPALQMQSWFAEAKRAVGVEPAAGRAAAAAFFTPRTASRAILTAERRRQQMPGTQSLDVRFTSEQTRLLLRARIDASSTPLVSVPLSVPTACVIDRISLLDDSVQPVDLAERGTIDLKWTRVAADRIVAVVQRPQAGRFRLEVAARLPAAPARSGTVPLVRAMIDDTVPMVVSWNTAQAAAEPQRSAEIFPDQPAPRYVLEEPGSTPPIEPPPAAEAAETAADRPPAEAGAIAPRVELADVRLAIDDRGRAWGIARFELVARDPVVQLQLPPGMRLFDALVDGQVPVPATPSAAGGRNTWELRLHDVRWPRSLMVVFAGDLGPGLADGTPVELPAPTIVGLPCARMLWMLSAPRGMLLRVGEPGRVVDEAALAAERAAAERRLAADFERAMAALDAPDRERLREHMGLRGKRAAARPGAAWEQAAVEAGLPPWPDEATVGVVMESGDDRLTVRAVRQRDPTVTPRAIVTLATLLLGGTALAIVRRRPATWTASNDWLLPAVAAVLGAAWSLLLEPALPGVLLVACGIAALAGRWFVRSRPPAGQPSVADDVTLTHAIGPGGAPAEG